MTDKQSERKRKSERAGERTKERERERAGEEGREMVKVAARLRQLATITSLTHTRIYLSAPGAGSPGDDDLIFVPVYYSLF